MQDLVPVLAIHNPEQHHDAAPGCAKVGLLVDGLAVLEVAKEDDAN